MRIVTSPYNDSLPLNVSFNDGRKYRARKLQSTIKIRENERENDRSIDRCAREERERERGAALRVDARSGQRAGHDIAHVL